MKSDEKNQNLILVIMLILILSLSYCAVPIPHDAPRKKISQRRWILRWELVDGRLPAPEKEAPAEHAAIEEDTTDEAEHETETHAPEAEVETAAAPEPEKEPAEEPVSVPEGVILMNNPKYKKHTKPIVQFTHQIHIDKYTKSCGECHHDDQGQPLDLQPDDPVDSCIACHKETKAKKGEKLPKAEKIKKYHKDALHANCISCHKAYNIEKGDPKGKKPAPSSCKSCHVES